MNIFDGPEGESLFNRPLLRLFRDNPLHELFQQSRRIDDDRFIAVLSALAVENRLDACLDAFLSRYPKLSESQDFGFSAKIRLMQALNFVPTLLLAASDLMRRVRNEFAHRLDREKFNDLPDDLRDKLCNVRASIYSRFGPEQTKPKQTLREEFEALAFFAIGGLDSYVENLRYLRRRIADAELIEQLYRQCAAENDAALRAVLASHPTEVEVRDGLTIERYPNGVVNVTNT